MYPEQAGFQSHSTTSRAAAEQCKTVKSMEEHIIMYLTAPAIGWTADELQQRLETPFPGVQAGTVGARLRGLELKGRIVKGIKTRPTRTGRQAHEWWLKENADQHRVQLAPSPETDSPESLRMTIRNLQRANKDAVDRATNAELRLHSALVKIEYLERKARDAKQ